MAYTSFNNEENFVDKSKFKSLFQNLTQYSGQAIRGTGKWMGTVIRAMQFARMKSVLNNLPDEYLNQAGINRSEINEYAQKMIYGEK